MDNQNRNFPNDLHDIINNNLDKNNQNLSPESLSNENIKKNKDKEHISSDIKIVEPQKTAKKKKKNYKNLMSDIMSANKKDEQIEKEEHLEQLKKSLGGGNFKKIDKI